MLPTTLSEINDNKDKVHSNVDQVNIAQETHPNDLIGSAMRDFFNKGGSSSFAHIFSKFGDVKSTFAKWIMEVQKPKKAGLTLSHGGQHVASLKTSNLMHCLATNNLGVRVAKQASDITLTFGEKKLTVQEEAFKPYETFLSDL